MYITQQEDLQFANVGGKQKLIGGVSLGRTYADMNVLSGMTIILATTSVKLRQLRLPRTKSCAN